MLRPLLLAGLLVAASGCTTMSQAPTGYVPRQDDVALDARGAWVRAEMFGGSIVAGELLAVTPDSLLILTFDDDVVGAEKQAVARVRLEAYRGEGVAVSGWAAAGTVSTLSHGVILGLSAPAWGIAGLIGSRSATAAGFSTVLPESLGSLAPHARFPQGMPPDLDRSTLEFLFVPEVMTGPSPRTESR